MTNTEKKVNLILELFAIVSSVSASLPIMEAFRIFNFSIILAKFDFYMMLKCQDLISEDEFTV